MKWPNLSLQIKFFLGMVFIIVPVLSIIFTWIGIHNESMAKEHIADRARILSNQIILTRNWISDCGGVMVRLDSKGARETFTINHNLIKTPMGTFQKFTPSMVTKKLSKYSLRQHLYHFSLASFNPINPENKPGSFEKAALNSFIRNHKLEFYRFDNDKAKPVFRYSVPLFIDNTCIKCHRRQGFSKGDIAGCLSIVLPVENMKKAIKKDHFKLAGAGVGFIALTILTLFVLLRKVVIGPLKELKTMAAEISKGNFEAKVNINTKDEFEHLGETFNKMTRELAINRDIMEEKIANATKELYEANENMRALDKIKNEFFADMSHELRSPLTAIRGGVDYLKRTLHIDDNISYLKIIDKNLDRLIHLVSDLFDLTKIEADKVEWEFEKENMTKLVQEVAEILSLNAEEKNIDIKSISDGEIYAEIDLERMEQVLVNLVENAIKFSGEGSCINIRLHSDNGYAKVSVEDRGIGIAPKDLEVIFKKFHSLPSSEKKAKPKGTGLGLTICKKIIEAHRGRIWAEARKGGGSRLSFVIPVKHRDSA